MTIEKKCEDWKSYHVYGVTIESDYRFTSPLNSDDTPPDVYFTCTNSNASAMVPPETPVYASRQQIPNGASKYFLYKTREYDLLRFTGSMDFYLQPGRIHTHLLVPDHYSIVESHFLGFALSLWLEQHGMPALHAAALGVDHGCVGLLATSGSGKSTLAACLMQAGCPLLSDDVLVIQSRDDIPYAMRSYPQLRMWPEQAQHVLGDIDHLERVHPTSPKRRVPVGNGGFGRFCDRDKVLACIYLLERRSETIADNSIHISELSPQEATIKLVQHSFVPNTVLVAMGLQRRHLELLARLAEQIPIRSITYPSGLEQLPRARDAILDDMRRR